MTRGKVNGGKKRWKKDIHSKNYKKWQRNKAGKV